MTTHAAIGFSSLPRIVRCPGSLKLSRRVPPKPDSAPAIEGRVAHWVAYQKWCGIDVPLGTMKDGVKVDEDMLAGAALWVETAPKEGIAELPVIAPSIHPTDCWGTPDLGHWDEAQSVLSVFEYKYGFQLVDEFENEQLIGQAAGIMDTLEIKPKHLRLVVVQPRGYGAAKIRTWMLTIEEFPAQLKRIQDAVNDNETTRVSPHCLYCPAAEICGTFQAAASDVVKYSGMAEPVILTPAQIGAEAAVLEDALKVLQARATVLNAMVEDQLRKGVRVPGWEMKSKQAALAWTKTPEELIKFGIENGIDLTKAIDVITPTQAKDRKLLDEKTLETLASRPSNSLKPARISTSMTRRIFA